MTAYGILKFDYLEICIFWHWSPNCIKEE